jgi:Phosphoesterase family
MRRHVFCNVLVLLALAACSSKPALPRRGVTPPVAFPQPAPFQRVFVVVLENTDAEDALAQPYLRQLANRGALLTDYAFVARPSQPNYLALTSASTHGVDTDRNVDLDVRHLGDLLEAKGRSWKSYAEDYPGGCFLKRSSERGHYVRKHQPFLSYRNVQSDPLRCQRVVAATEVARDIEAHALPDFSLFIPNNRNNGHEPSSVAVAARWLERTFEGYLQDRDFMDGMLFVVTFDESSMLHTRPIYTVLVGDSVKPGVTDDFPYDHYSLLRTVEEAFGLGTLGLEDEQAVAISGVWK